jgi:DNA invertase Pin-like site-specific DNA recombinase
MTDKSKRAALYVRVSTDKQTVENQVQELTAIAKRRGWQIVETYRDSGISGTKGRDQRPGLDAMLKDACKGRFDVVMTWALDRLGRSTIDLLTNVKTLEECGAGLFVEQQNIDSTSVMGKLVFTIFAGIAAFEREMLQQRVAIGIKRAREQGTKSGKPFGRPRLDEKTADKVRAMLSGGAGIIKTAKHFKLGNGTVSRIKHGDD